MVTQSNTATLITTADSDSFSAEPAAIPPEVRSTWEVPAFDIALWHGKLHRWCVVIPVINEGERIRSQLATMAALKIHEIADVIVVDGGSDDDSLDLEYLNERHVRGLLVNTGPGKLCAQLRCGYAFGLDQGYEGIITIDGNDKDDPSPVREFIQALDDGVDFVQGSRYIEGGYSENTPFLREWGIRLLHAPLMRWRSGFPWTDTTQGFRAYSRNMLLDPGIAPFRDVFLTYELIMYLSARAPKLGFRCAELPTRRCYPEGKVPTKISSFRGNILMLRVLFEAAFGVYDPK